MWCCETLLASDPSTPVTCGYVGSVGPMSHLRLCWFEWNRTWCTMVHLGPWVCVPDLCQTQLTKRYLFFLQFGWCWLESTRPPKSNWSPFDFSPLFCRPSRSSGQHLEFSRWAVPFCLLLWRNGKKRLSGQRSLCLPSFLVWTSVFLGHKKQQIDLLCPVDALMRRNFRQRKMLRSDSYRMRL